MILVAKDVGQHGVRLSFQDEAHGDARRPAPRSGTPASIRASEAPQTVAMEDEPFDSSNLGDDPHRVGKSSCGRQHRMDRAPASLPWPISRRPGEPSRPVSPTENGGKL